jgi:hypothetical protein
MMPISSFFKKLLFSFIVLFSGSAANAQFGGTMAFGLWNQLNSFTAYWLGGGGGFSGGFISGGALGAANIGDGRMNSAAGIGLDTSGNLYVADYSNNRINKYTSTGSFVGWLGNIATSPTGGASGCSGASVGTFTPGWCTGGTAQSSTIGNGSVKQPISVYGDSTYIYVLEYGNNRISKYVSSTGSFIGWIGSIYPTSPTGGDAGCNGAAIYTFTPGWCTGGASTLGGGTGGMNNPTDIYIDTSGNIYVTNVYSINKYTSTGSFVGWIGNVGSSPTGGATGCSGRSAGLVTPGWCTGGSAATTGIFSGGTGIFGDASGYLYMTQAAQVVRITSLGVIDSWIGGIATSPTGGASGCNGAAVGTVTPGWCTGGGDESGTSDGMFSSASGVALDTSGNIYTTDSANSRVNKYSSMGTYLSALGQITTSPQPWTTNNSTNAAQGTTDGALNHPDGVQLDSLGNMYVADANNSRIMKFSASGSFIGWIGAVGTSPTGGATGCNGAAVGTFTPGWCTGGTAKSGTGDGMLTTPNFFFIDASNYIYVADWNNSRVSRYTTSGSFAGWIGAVGTPPTGGVPGCSGATVGTATPGWCTGGTAQSGTGDGLFSNPAGTFVDLGGSLYISDIGNHRVSKYVASTGAFVGWIGAIGSSPTGGSTGCAGSTGVTPGWCTGGVTSTALLSHPGNGSMYYAAGISGDNNGSLYITDESNARILKYTTAGAFVGWLGSTSSSAPTGGAAGCTSTHSALTPGWCTGGGSLNSSIDGAFNSPTGVTTDLNGNIYVTDYINQRVTKYTSSGTYLGWIGGIGTSPTGGATGCNGATIGTTTAGWCKGGNAKSGTLPGMMNGPNGIFIDNHNVIYVGDSNNNRIDRYNPK